MLYCFDKKLNFDYSKSEMLMAQKRNNGILYDSTTKEFEDFVGNKIDITGKLIFPRTGVAQAFDMNNEIINNGGIPIINNDEINYINNWPNHYVANRKIEIFKGKDLINPGVIEYIRKEYGEYIFLKTKDKNFSSIIPIELLNDKECVFYKALRYHLEDDFIISEKIDILEDEYGLREYRCFIINNEIYNISRFTTNVFHKIDKNILEKLKQIVEDLKDNFPNSYVLDLCEYKMDNQIYIDVVEFNSIESSGIYLYNSIMEKSENLLHSDITKISEEFLDKKEDCSVEGKMFNERNNLYNVPNSFSSDLRSIYLTGDIGLTYSAEINSLSIEQFASHKKLFDFENMEPLTDDDLISDEEDLFTSLKDDIPEDMIKQIQKLLKLEKK